MFSESVRFFPHGRRGVDEDMPHISESRRTHEGAIRAELTQQEEREGNYAYHGNRKLQTAFPALKLA
jgi:hypothetical protein